MNGHMGEGAYEHGGVGDIVDIAAAVRRIAKPDSRLRIPDAEPTPAGVESVSRSLTLLVVRTQMFIKATRLAGVNHDMPTMQDYLDAHRLLVTNLSMLRSGLVGPLEVPDVVESIRDASADLARKRKRVLNRLPEVIIEDIRDVEWRVPVTTEDLRDEMDFASSMISRSAEGALESKWFDELDKSDKT